MNLKAEADGVDGEARATGVVLQRSRQEGLREEEAADPEHGWNPVGDPVLQETDALQEVGYPGGQWLERRVRLEEKSRSALRLE